MNRKTLFVCIALLSSCKSVVVAEFEADPEFVCVPGETELSWDVRSRSTPSISLSVTSTEAPAFEYANLPHRTTSSTGVLDVSVPQGRTEIQLSATASGRSAQETVSVEGLGSETLAGGFVFEPNCGEGGRVNGWYDIDASGYGPGVVTRGVSNSSDRQIIITHAGISRAIEPGVFSSAWNGTSLNGRWSVAAELLSRAGRGAEMVTESCDPGVGPGGSVSPVPGDSTRTIPLQPLTATFTFGCD